MQYAYDLHGSLSLPALRDALSDLAARHDVLRTTLRQVGGEVRQVVGDQAPMLEAATVVGDTVGERQAESVALAEQMARQPFDLGEGPVYRAGLWRYDVDRHLFVLVFHHCAVDDWSAGLIERDLSAYYAMHVGQGAARALPPAPQYADAVSARPRRDMTRHLAYWQRQLAGAQPTELPADNPPAPGHRRRAGQHQVELGATVAAGLDRLARECGVTRFVALLTVCVLFLARHSGTEDVCLGTSVTCREEEDADVVGFFLNSVALRVRVDWREGFRTLAGQVRDVFAAAAVHRHCPFNEVADALGAHTRRRSNPLFRVMFSYLRDEEHRGLRWPGITSVPVRLPLDQAQFDVAIVAGDGAKGVTWAVEYADELYQHATVSRWTESLASLLLAALAHPDVLLSELAPATARERAQLAVPDGPRAAPVAGDDLMTRLSCQVVRGPGAIALRQGTDQLTFADFGRAVDALSARLAGAGVTRGGYVATLMPVGFAAVAAAWASWRIGAAWLPLDVADSPDRLAEVVNALDGPVAVLAGPQTAFAAEASLTAPVIVVGPELRSTAEQVGHPGSVPCADRDDLACVVATSGTGRRVCVRHSALIDHAYRQLLPWYATIQARLGRPVQVALTAPCHSRRFVTALLALLAGHTLVLPDERLPVSDCLSRLTRYGAADVLDCTTAQLELLAAAGALDTLDGGIALIRFGGEPLLPPLREKLRGLAPVVAQHEYEAAEIAAVISCDAIASSPAWSAGRPADGALVYVLGQDLRPAPIGVVGEVFVGGPGVAHGYLGRSGSTAAALLPDPFHPAPGARMFRTGDLGRLRSDQHLELRGRLDDQITGGERRIARAEIEAAICDVPPVRQAAVVGGGPDADTGGLDRLVAFVCCAEGSSLSQPALRSALAGRLPPYAVPDAYLRLPRLPLTRDGRVDRARLAQIWRRRTEGTLRGPAVQHRSSPGA